MGLSEDEILNYLMTSDFNEGLTPEEYKLLLRKFRNFYRVLRGKYDNSLSEISVKQKEIKDIKEDKQVRYNELMYEKNRLQELNEFILSRNLSWKERWKGKIILNKDEIKRL